MAIHNMGLYEDPFNSIKSGRKTVEVRLNDEKRRKLLVGDTIQFTKLPEQDSTVIVRVLQLIAYDTFKILYENIPSVDFDCRGMSLNEMLEGTHTTYSPEQEMQWGTLAITIRLVEEV